MLLLSILVFLAPLAVYCWVLAVINRRSKPTMVSGTLDCAGMLLASAGILLVVGPVLVNTLFIRKMSTLPLVAGPDEAFGQAWRQHWFFWGLYFTLMPLVVCLLLWWRRNKTVIYNVDPDTFLPVLQQTLEHLDLTSTRAGNRWVVAGNAVMKQKATASAEVLVEAFPSLCNVSLHWLHADDKLRSTIENELAHTLEGARTLDNPAAAWLLGATGVLCGVLFLTGMVWVLINYLPPRHW